MTRLEHASTWQVDTKTIHLYIGKGTLQVASNLIYSQVSLSANVVSDTAVDLLHVVKCNCKTDCHCAKCSCRKQGFICRVWCESCRRESCLNPLIKTDSDDAVNINDECRKQWLDLENIITCVCLKCICFFIGPPIAVIPFKPRVFSNNRSPIFYGKAMAAGTWHLGTISSTPACIVVTSDQQ